MMDNLQTGIEKKFKRRQENEMKRRVASLNHALPKPKPKPPRKERQEIHCHECNRYVQFDIDMGLDGQHVLNCPNCGHLHYRVVRNGIITAERWGRDPSQDMPIYSASNITYTTTMTISAGSSTSYIYDTTGWSSTSDSYATAG